MADNVDLPATGVKAAADEVTYSGDTSKVQLARIVATTGAEGSKTVVENMPASLGQKTKAASFPVTLASDSDAMAISGAVTASGTLDLGATDNAVLDAIAADGDAVQALLTTIDADTGNLAAMLTALQLIDNIVSGSAAQVAGNVAHDAADSGNPVKIGGVAVDFESMPADVTVGDRVNAAYTPKGIAGVALFHPTLSTPLETLPVSVSSGEVSVSVIGALPGAATGTLSNVNDSATNVTLLASNAARKGASFFNDSTQVLYLKHAATATTTSFTTKVQPDQLYELPGPTIYTGIVDGIWAADGAGACRVTELT